MAIRISRADHTQLLRWAREAAPEECCGLLFGDAGHIIGTKLVTNVAADKLRYFEIDPEALIAAHKAARNGGAEICGYFHSHPNGRAKPSQYDRQIIKNDNKFWLIVASGTIRCWQMESADLVEQDVKIID